jgi:hypothetical protein
MSGDNSQMYPRVFISETKRRNAEKGKALKKIDRKDGF